MKELIWLASYPKSGNTWLRILFSNLLSNSDMPDDINNISLNECRMNQRDQFEELTLLDHGILKATEIDRLIALMAAKFCEEASVSKKPFFAMTHRGYEMLETGEPVLGRNPGYAAVYILRDPRDVAASMAFYGGNPVAVTVRNFLSDHTFAGNRRGRLTGPIPERIPGWSAHVRSWTRQRDIPVFVIRYEDLRRATAEILAAAAGFLELPAPPDAVERAVAFSDFAELQRQEALKGYSGRTIKGTAPFFRAGRVGGWREVLTPAQADAIVAAHGGVMAEFGYI